MLELELELASERARERIANTHRNFCATPFGCLTTSYALDDADHYDCYHEDEPIELLSILE